MEYKIPLRSKGRRPPESLPLGGYLVQRRGRFWAVIDAAESLVCLTVYKCGALEVVRRLSSAKVV